MGALSQTSSGLLDKNKGVTQRKGWCLFQKGKTFQEILTCSVLAELKLYNRKWEIQLFQLGLLLPQTKLGFC